MSDLIQPLYPWNRSKVTMKKRNQEFGNIISLNFIFLYYLLFVYVTSGKVYPILRQADINLLGNLSAPVIVLRFLVFKWWISVILFFLTLIITFFVTALITKTRPSLFRTYIEYIRIDTKNQPKKEVGRTILKDILEIGGYSIVSFLVLELLTFAISSLIVTMVLPLTYSITEVSLSYFFLAILISHILFFPLLVFFYNRMISKKMSITSGIDLQKFLTDDGEVDIDKWKRESWGKKPYSFDWEEEDVFPITCFSCGSIISSNLTICPICDTDLIKEIEIIESETSENDEIIEEPFREDEEQIIEEED
jgi:hypothetical protein